MTKLERFRCDYCGRLYAWKHYHEHRDTCTSLADAMAAQLKRQEEAQKLKAKRELTFYFIDGETIREYIRF